MSINKFLMVVTLSIFISACSEKSDKDTWIVATSPDNPPYEHMKDGEIEGHLLAFSPGLDDGTNSGYFASFYIERFVE